MSRTELKMQPTIHLEGKAGYLLHPYPGLRSKCIVGCIFLSILFGLIITCAHLREVTTVHVQPTTLK
jgi:hypothetical protein